MNKILNVILGGGGKQFRGLETLIKIFSSFFDFKRFKNIVPEYKLHGAFTFAKTPRKGGEVITPVPFKNAHENCAKPSFTFTKTLHMCNTFAPASANPAPKTDAKAAFTLVDPAHKRLVIPAFTLAETLITLAIIGVVAAMTIPGVIENGRKTEYTSKIKKFISTLMNASILSKANDKDWDYWAESALNPTDTTGDTAVEFAEEYLLPYLSYINIQRNDEAVHIYLNDGTVFSVKKGTCIDFYFDANGAKKPNKAGKDRYRFLYCPASSNSVFETGKIISYKTKAITTREIALEYCKDNGIYCSGLLEFDGFEFKKDYPEPGIYKNDETIYIY